MAALHRDGREKSRPPDQWSPIGFRFSAYLSVDAQLEVSTRQSVSPLSELTLMPRRERLRPTSCPPLERHNVSVDMSICHDRMLTTAGTYGARMMTNAATAHRGCRCCTSAHMAKTPVVTTPATYPATAIQNSDV